VLKEDDQSVSLLTPGGTGAAIQKSQIKARRKAKASIMPDGLADTIDRASMRNLAEFLTR
jgi:putative heme-binding domain-containing protein